ncbi:PilZ domain-containing protein [Desulfosediminicola flagellatus]|uniref:PilZ domain-containing protein n=1 Tax=Desulfosediminicola flagellatus TaxID=2569541 RepID=UPI0010ABC36D|nr:PilZ domain-containing protein [Desulfosediminicola flagellatus]
MVEKRQFIRHDAIHLLDYVVIDDDGNEGVYSMGRTLDVSTSGLKLETTHYIKPESTLRLTVGLGDDLIDLGVTVAHCHKVDEGTYISGVCFTDLYGEAKRILALYIDVFNERKVEKK